MLKQSPIPEKIAMTPEKAVAGLPAAVAARLIADRGDPFLCARQLLASFWVRPELSPTDTRQTAERMESFLIHPLEYATRLSVWWYRYKGGNDEQAIASLRRNYIRDNEGHGTVSHNLN